jgi:predicted metal-dependent hydrolase
MDNVTIINTPLAMQAAFKLLKSDVAAFTKRLGAHSDELQKLNARFAAQQVLEKAEARKEVAARRKLQVASLGDDLAKMTKRVKRHPTGHGAY